MTRRKALCLAAIPVSGVLRAKPAQTPSSPVDAPLAPGVSVLRCEGPLKGDTFTIRETPGVDTHYVYDGTDWVLDYAGIDNLHTAVSRMRDTGLPAPDDPASGA